jgi:CubicO group peptidase (beta-lactamase class C family)
MSSFAYFSRNIPDEAHHKIGDMGPAGVQAFAFTPDGGWVIVTNGGYFARGIPDECFQKLGEFINDGHKIRVIAFPPEGGNRWLIVTDKTYFARNIPDACYAKLGEMWNAGARPTSVAFPYPGGDRWVILAGKTLFAHGIDDECFQLLVNYSQGLRPAHRVAFTPSGGWVILAQDRYFARRIPDECYQEMGQFAKTLEVDHVNFAPNGGWSIISNTAAQNYPSDPLRAFESRILQVNGQWQSIRQRMDFYHVPGVSLAVVLNNKIGWACSYGQTRKGSSDWIHTDTVFQAASCSKPVAGVGFLRLVESNLIGLNDDVNPKLGWTLPQRACAGPGWKSKVNLFRLLRHQGGIIGRGATNPTNQCSGFASGGGGGFNGYANLPGVGVPTVIEVLNGASGRAGVTVNSHRVELTYDPGSMSAYSGEGFTLMQQLLEHQREMSLADWMKTNVLGPAGMANSTFFLAAPSFSGPPSTGHDNSGEPIPGDRNRYPESAAAGLYTTATDLCRLIIAINQNGTIDGNHVLSGELTTSLLQNSLGMDYSNGFGTLAAKYGKGGDNHGYKCGFAGYPGKQAGYAVMTNGDQGGALNGEIATALAAAYGWE